MASKARFLAGFATGYVLGSRAGRERYEQIRRTAKSIAASPPVRRTTDSLQQQAGEALSAVKAKAGGAVADRLNERRPAWLGSSASTSSASGEATWAAGSNGHVGA
jgi:hypothetical protein